MPFHLTSDQILIQKTVRELVETLKGKPAEHIDRERAFPKEALAQVAGLGLMGMLVPAEMGGAGTDTVTFALALEEVARASGVVALTLNNANALGSFPVASAASPELAASVLPDLVSGQKFAAWGMSEPNAGSDISSISTRARRDGDEVDILNGLKSFVVGAPHAAWFIVFAKVPTTEGLTAFLVPADAACVQVAPREATMTMRGSDMAQVFFRDVHVPASHRLGAEGTGGDLAQKCNELAALGGAAIALGLMQAAFEDAVAYSGDREQFRMPIKKFQAIQHLVADLDVKIRASRLLTYAAADKRDRGEEFAVDVAAAKLFAGEAAKLVTQKSLRIHGGTGFMRDLPVERYNRDARSLSIYAGTAEQERGVLAARALGL
jgi:alkylation response protein AidB-like acyl-CoA dehydrogenase